MKKILTTLALVVGLLLGGTVALASPAAADCTTPGSTDPGCTGTTPGTPTNPCTDPARSTDPACALKFAELEQTANDYRAQVVALTEANAALTAKAERLQRVADRRAETIKELRAKLRALR